MWHYEDLPTKLSWCSGDTSLRNVVLKEAHTFFYMLSSNWGSNHSPPHFLYGTFLNLYLTLSSLCVAGIQPGHTSWRERRLGPIRRQQKMYGLLRNTTFYLLDAPSIKFTLCFRRVPCRKYPQWWLDPLASTCAQKRPEGIEWFIEDQAFLLSHDSAPRLPSSPFSKFSLSFAGPIYWW